MSELPHHRSAPPASSRNAGRAASGRSRAAIALIVAASVLGLAGRSAGDAYSPSAGEAYAPNVSRPTATPDIFDVTPVPQDGDDTAAPAAAPPAVAPATERPARRAAQARLAKPRPAAPRREPGAARGGGGPPALAPPNGTYVYALSRDGTDQGKTTVVIFRRAATRTIEVDEALSVGELRAQAFAGFAYDTLVPNLLTATYQAPFPPGSLLGSETPFRPRVTADGQTSVRYAFAEPDAPIASIDGVQGLFTWPLDRPETRSPLTGLTVEPTPSPEPAPDPQRKAGAFALDAPLMSGWALFPAWLRKGGATAITPVGLAFPEYVSDVRVARINLPPHSKKTPRDAVAKRIGDFATVWFDPQSQIVYELHLDSLNLDARLLDYSKVTTTAPFEPAPQTSPTPPPESTVLNVSVDGGAALAGIVQFPQAAKKNSPAIVLVAPPVGDALPTRDYGGTAQRSMFGSIAKAFLDRGFVVVRYDARGVGKSSGSYADLTWEQSVDDLGSVVSEVQGTDGIDASRVFVMGYKTGADVAFAAAANEDNKIAGVVALDPTLVSYRDALERQYVNAQTKPDDKAAAERAFEHDLKRLGKPDEAPGNGGVWYKSALVHNPVLLDARSVVPAFVLHSSSTDPARTPDDVRAFDDRLRAADSLVTAIVASDLSDRFGGRYDADAPEDTEAIFPYSFDPSTAGAIADWLGGVHGGERGTAGRPLQPATPGVKKTPPAPPPLQTHSASGNGMPVKRQHVDDAQPGQVGVPSTLAEPTPSPPTPQPTAPPTQSPPAPHAT